VSGPERFLGEQCLGSRSDLEYRPVIMTPLLRQVHQQMHRGWVPLNGLENLTAQASVQFELFTDRRPPQGLMQWQAESTWLIAD